MYKDKEREKAYKKKWALEHKEKTPEQIANKKRLDKIYREKNKDKIKQYYHDNKERFKIYHENNKEGNKKAHLRYKLKNIDKYKNWDLRRKYNITIDEYNKLFENQEGYCAICGVHQSTLNSSLCVDHNHSTNKIRGLLCKNCNLILGNAKENIRILKNAIKYLEEYDTDAKND